MGEPLNFLNLAPHRVGLGLALAFLALGALAACPGGRPRPEGPRSASSPAPRAPDRSDPAPFDLGAVEPYFAGSRAGGFGAAMTAFSQRDPRTARSRFVAALSAAPNAPAEEVAVARVLSAIAAARSGESALAAAELGALAAAPPAPLEPIGGYLHLFAARAALDAGDFALARSEAHAVATGVPPSVSREARRIEAQALERLGRGAEAEAVLRSLVAEGEFFEDVARLAGRLLAEPPSPSRTIEAAHLLRRVRILAPWTAQAADAETRLAAILPAIPAADRAALERYAPEELYARAEAYFDRQDNAESERAFAEVVASAPESSEIACRARLQMARSVMKARDRARAASLFAETAARCPFAAVRVEALYFGGKMAAAAGDHRAAIAQFAEVERAFGGHTYADDARLQAALSYRDLGEREPFQRLLGTLGTTYPTGDMRGEAFFNLAEDHIDHDEWLDARRVLERNLETLAREDLWYQAGRALYWHGRALGALGDSAAAIGSYRRAVREYPLTYYMLQAFNRIREIDASAAARLLVEISLGAGPRPLALFETPLTRSPGFRRGVLLLRLSLRDEARGEFERLGIGAGSRPEDLWLLASLYDRAEAWDLAHGIPRRLVTDWKWRYPAGEDWTRWQLAFPRGYAPLVEATAQSHGYPSLLFYAFIREESSFNPDDESYANAVGLTQMIPPTARRFGRPLGLPVDRQSLRRPDVNVAVGGNFLAFLWGRYGGAIPLVIPAYNAGEGAVDRWHRARGTEPLDRFLEHIPFDQTRRYTMRVLASYETYVYLYGSAERVIVLSAQTPARPAPATAARGAAAARPAPALPQAAPPPPLSAPSGSGASSR